ncbi:HD domain-containing phosphohydrolase [Mariprofundus ferrooxydans]|uniref:HD domain-containing phosphohydrolase n=1 Tax=Mariprofundus ferrooxydans TaxID=314344 RepID=UPI00143201B6|nr:HD domain-containing phosphohydrolase [Mariprofundus ferrooxydans]
MRHCRNGTAHSGESLLPNIIDVTHDAIISVDQDQNILLFNKSAEDIFGYKASEIVGKPLDVLIPSAYCSIHRQHVQELIDGDLVVRPVKGYLDIQGLRKDGTIFSAEAAVAKTEINGEMVYTATLRDISAHQLAREKNERLSLLRLALCKTRVATLQSQSEDKLFQQACRNAVEFGGLKMAWVGLLDDGGPVVRPVAQFGDGVEYLQAIDTSIRDEVPIWHVPIGIAVREERPYWCEGYHNEPFLAPWNSCAAIPVHCNGKVVAVFSVYSDEIDAFDEIEQNLLLDLAMEIEHGLVSCAWQEVNKALEETRRESELKFSAIIDASPVPLALNDEQGNIVYLNNAFTQTIGYTPAEIPTLAEWWSCAYPDPEYRESLQADWQNRLTESKRDGKIFTPIEVDITCKDGLVRNFMAGATPLGESFNGIHLVTLAECTERKAAMQKVEDANEQLQESVYATIRGMSALGDAADPYTSGHELRVADIAVAIALEMGLSELMVEGIRLGSEIHDIGKISIPIEILSKQGRLTEQEYNLVKLHAQTGYDILKDLKFPWPLADIVHQHHERLDGTGYPRGLKDAEICMEARIVAIADVVEAMSSHRPYRPDLGFEMAVDEIKAHRGTRYWPDGVDALLRLVEKKLLPIRPNTGGGD